MTSTDAPKSSSAPVWSKDFVCGTLINFAIAANYFMLMVVMTAYALNVFDAPASLAALCASVFIIGTLFARFISPPLMAKLGRKPTLILGAVLEVLFTALYLLDEPIGALIGVRFLHGMTYGVCSTTVATVVTSIVPAQRKGEGIGYFMLSTTLGSAVGPFMGIFLSNNVGYHAVFIIACAIVALGVPFSLALKPPIETSVQGNTGKALEEGEAAVDAMAANEASAPQEAAKDERAGDAASEASLRRDAHRSGSLGRLGNILEWSVMPISCVCGLLFFGYSSLLTFLTPYATELGLTAAASVFFVAYALAMFITRPFTGRAFDRYGPVGVMTTAFFSFSIGMVLIAFCVNDWMLLGSALLLGYGVGTVQSCGLALAVRIAPNEHLSLANATFYILLDVGVGIGPVVLGVVMPLVGYHWLYLGMAAVGMLAFALFMAVARHPRAQRISQAS